jgi:hypothetical protein
MSASNERRVRVERRLFDFGPPHACRDRRVFVERRLPLVEECTVSHAEFETYFGRIDLCVAERGARENVRATFAEAIEAAATA